MGSTGLYSLLSKECGSSCVCFGGVFSACNVKFLRLCATWTPHRAQQMHSSDPAHGHN